MMPTERRERLILVSIMMTTKRKGNLILYIISYESRKEERKYCLSEYYSANRKNDSLFLYYESHRDKRKPPLKNIVMLTRMT